MSFPIETIRHSASHVLAQAVLHYFPDAKLAIGPAIDEGFYYDFELSRSLTDEDLEKFESKMKEIIKERQTFTQHTLDRSDTLDLLSTTDQPYKLEIVNDLGLDEYSFFENGPFKDLCRGPHVENTGQVGAVKLLKVSGAYWRGDEKNIMLQRIYGTAFPNEKQLRLYLKQLEEAKKRDHRVLGKELELFSINEEMGPGLILWHPKGSRIRHTIETYWKDAHFKQDYQLLYSPHVGKENLWQTSGHLDFYKESMFNSVDIENASYFVKPMNCPFHIMYYKSKRWSYRELPLKLAELGTVYRYERSGVLHGLMRVRGFTQDDAHIFCAKEQMKEEILSVLHFCLNILKTFDFENFELYLSTRPKEKYVGDTNDWNEAESALQEALETLGVPFKIDEGGGAFYGPKIDIKIEDAIGRKWQCSTVQFDFNLPERFDLNYTAADGKNYRPYMIHRALLGSIERFLGILIEHYAGKFPFWLAPVQIKILSVSDAVHDFCQQLEADLKNKGIAVEFDSSKEKLGYKVRLAQAQKVPYMLIIGDKEAEAKKVSVRSRDKGMIGEMSLEALEALIQDEIKVVDSGKNALYSEIV